LFFICLKISIYSKFEMNAGSFQILLKQLIDHNLVYFLAGADFLPIEK